MLKEFKLIKNTLEDPKSNVPRVEYENEYYIIKIIYNKNYIEDKKSNTLSKENIKIVSKAKDSLFAPHIGFANGNVTITLPSITLYDTEMLAKFTEKYEAACTTKAQIEDTLEKII